MRNIFFNLIAISLAIQWVQSNTISFNMEDCKLYIDYREQIVFTCISYTYIGNSKQAQPLGFMLSNPLSLTLADTHNFIFNSRCTQRNRCKYAESRDFFSEIPQRRHFFQESSSTSLEIIQKNYTKDLVGYSDIQGDLESDNFYLSYDDESIQLEFLSVYNFTQTVYIGNGLLSLINGNQNGIFMQGYLQKKLITPIFQFGLNSLSSELQIDYNITKNQSYPILKTYSKNNWDVRMTGLQIDGRDLLNYAHYQTFIIQTYVYPALPKNSHLFISKLDIAKYVKQKYSDYFSDSYQVLINCSNCSCKSDFPDLEIYTVEYKISIPLSEFMTTSLDGGCQINTSSSNLLIGIQQIIQNSVTFDPLEGEVQFPGFYQYLFYKRAQLIKHPSITLLQVIFFQSHFWLILALSLLIKYERICLNLKEETEKFQLKQKSDFQKLKQKLEMVKVKQEINE